MPDSFLKKNAPLINIKGAFFLVLLLYFTFISIVETGIPFPVDAFN